MEGELIGRDEELSRLVRVMEERRRATVAVGDAGVGKTRLLAEVAHRAEQKGWVVRRIQGSASGRDIALGAVSHLLPAAAEDVATAFRALRARLGPAGSGGRVLLVVDDAHDLDEGSGALVHQMLLHEEARVVLASRNDARGPLSLRSLWQEDGVERVELRALDRRSTDQLIASVLGGPASTSLLDDVWQLSRGHPLYVRVALDAAIDRGQIERVDGRWTAPAGIGTDRLRDLVLARVHDLPHPAQDALRFLSIATSLRDRTLRALASDGVEPLAERGLVRSWVDDAAGRIHEIAHPLFADIVLAELSAGARSLLRHELAQGLLADERPSDDDLLRATLWLIDDVTTQPPTRAHEAASVAIRRGDWLATERIARWLLQGRPDSSLAGIALGRALAYQGRAAEADEVLAAVEPGDVAETADLALVRAHNLAFGLGQIGAALGLLASTADLVDDAARWRLQADRSLYSAIVGDFTETLVAARATLDDPRTPPGARCAASVNLTLAQAMTGQLDDFDSTIDVGLRLAQQHSAELPLAREQILIAGCAGWLIAGRVEQARAGALGELGDAAHAETDRPMAATWLAIIHGLDGHFGEADRWIERALAAYQRDDPFRLGSQAIGIGVLHRAQSGRLRPGDAAALDRAQDDAGDETRLRIWVDRARSWMLSATDPDLGASLAAEAGNRAIERDHVGWGAMTLHDLVRRGDPAGALTGLVRAAGSSSGAHLVDAMRDHAEAALAADPAALDEVGRRFSTMGASLLGAEAHAAAAELRARAGDEAGGRRSAFLAWRLLPVGAARTPPVRGLLPSLTEREADIAERAGDGASSRAIADELFLSVRTVDNHLHRVYRKLGLSGRAELRSLLDGDVEQSVGPD